ncbi:hypothetical protein ABW20_dc0107539 [Dactylellina cionopaga]|nr:hypothetical protein ABW20_dc0107539 [Dactylellina cionopaga]
MFDQKDFKSRFPRGFGDPITRHKCNFPNGTAIIHQGGPVDLKDPESIAREVDSLLEISHLEPATEEQVVERAQSDVEGIIYDKDCTYRYFVWLTVSRKYRTATSGDKGQGRDANTEKDAVLASADTSTASFDADASADADDATVTASPTEGSEGERKSDEGRVITKTIKVPFLVWFGSAMSFLSFDIVNFFFSDPEVEFCTQFPLEVDGEPFVFHAPDDHSNFNHYCILGRDFLESRFKAVDADYENLKVVMKRRKVIPRPRCEPTPVIVEDTPASKWIRERDEDLERYLDEDDDSGGEADDEGGGCGDEERDEGTKYENLEMNIDPRLLVLDHGMTLQQRKSGGGKEKKKKVDKLVGFAVVDEEGDVKMENLKVNKDYGEQSGKKEQRPVRRKSGGMLSDKNEDIIESMSPPEKLGREWHTPLIQIINLCSFYLEYESNSVTGIRTPKFEAYPWELFNHFCLDPKPH